MKNVVAVTADSLRADHCGWQSTLSLTPNLDRIASESVKFTTAIAPGPRTLSSVPVTHTGVPFASTDHDTSKYSERIARIQSHIERFETISERLRQEGYQTVAFTANPWTSTDNSFDTGFDSFREVGRDGGRIRGLFDNTPLRTPARLFDKWLHKDSYFSQWRTFYDDIIETVQTTDAPYFVWVFLLDTHNPYLIPSSDREELTTWEMYSTMLRANNAFDQSDSKTKYRSSLSDELVDRMGAAYRDSVRSVDQFAGTLYDDIEDDTLFLFHSDHGEAFGEHGTFGHEPRLYEENIHVPLFVSGNAETATIDEPVSTASIPDILASYATESAADPYDWTTDYAVARNESDSAIALRGERWKYIDHDGEEELYDLTEDPGETHNLVSERLEVVSRLRDRRQSFVESLPAPPSTTDSVESDDMRQHLQSLGYLQK